MEGFTGNSPAEEVNSSESLEVAEKAALEKLESLLGEKPIEHFSVRFMNIDEYRKLMRGEFVGSGQSNIFKDRNSVGLLPKKISKITLDSLQARIKKGFGVEASLGVIHDESVRREQLKRRINVNADKVKPEDFEENIPISKLSREEFCLLKSNANFEGFLSQGVSSGWFRLARNMTDWEASIQAVRQYSGYTDNKLGDFEHILKNASKKAKENNFDGKNGIEKKNYYLSFVREEILKSTWLFEQKFDIENGISNLRDDLKHFQLQLSEDEVTETDRKTIEDRIKNINSVLRAPELEYLETIHDFEKDEHFLEVDGNLQKLFFAISSLGDMWERMEREGFSVKGFQYHVAVIFKLNGDEGGGVWAKDQWGYAGRDKDNILGVVSIIPDRELEREVVDSSKGLARSSFPVFNNYGSLKFPQLVDSAE